MVATLYTARNRFRVTNNAGLRAVHTARMLTMHHPAVAVHDVATPVDAYVNENRWLIDCECGSGVLADPQLSIACCFGCGAVHTAVLLPSSAAQVVIERALLARPDLSTRGWRDGSKDEPIAHLLRENVEHGIPLSAALIAAARAAGVPVPGDAV